MTRTIRKPVKIFCCYSHKDERYLKRLKTGLALLERQEYIEEWHDRKIGPGREWDMVIDQNLETSKIILLLISPDFIASNYAYEKEMKRALEKHEQREARVLPIIVRPTDLEGAPFHKLQALPKDAKPITTWSNQDSAWLDVVKGIRDAVEELVGKPSEYEQEGASTRDAAEPAESVRQPSGDERLNVDSLTAYLGTSPQVKWWAKYIESLGPVVTPVGFISRDVDMAHRVGITTINEIDRLLEESRGWGPDYLREFYENSSVGIPGNPYVLPYVSSVDLNAVTTLLLIGNFPDVFTNEVLDKEFNFGRPERATEPAKKYNPRFLGA